MSIPFPADPKLIPDLGALSSFTSVISNQIVIAPKEEDQVGKYKISFLLIDKKGKATRVDTQLKVKVHSKATNITDKLAPQLDYLTKAASKIKVRIHLKSVNPRG